MARKTKLARAKALADKHCSAHFQGQPCAVCGSTVGTVGHHIVTRSVGFLRHDPENILPLCVEHHTGGNMAPHSTSSKAQHRFEEFIRRKYPGRFEWLQELRHGKTILTAEDYEAEARYWKNRKADEDGN